MAKYQVRRISGLQGEAGGQLSVPLDGQGKDDTAEEKAKADEGVKKPKRPKKKTCKLCSYNWHNMRSFASCVACHSTCHEECFPVWVAKKELLGDNLDFMVGARTNHLFVSRPGPKPSNYFEPRNELDIHCMFEFMYNICDTCCGENLIINFEQCEATVRTFVEVRCECILIMRFYICSYVGRDGDCFRPRQHRHR